MSKKFVILTLNAYSFLTARNKVLHPYTVSTVYKLLRSEY